MPRHSHTKDKMNALTFDSANEIVQSSSSIRQILEALEIGSYRSDTYDYIRNRFTELGIDYSHITKGRTGWIAKYGHMCSSRANRKRFPNELLFVENSKTDRGSIKNRILKDNLIPYICLKCGMSPVWKNKPLTLTLDHINGINNDNRLENLRFLCPNCNSQTETYGSRNIKKRHE